MILKINLPGRGFAAALAYQLQPGKGAEIVGGTMGGEDAATLAREFADWRALNHRVGRPAFCASLAAAPDEHLTSEHWRAIARTLTDGLGYAECPWVAIRHRDTPIDHIHLVAARIDCRGRRVADFQERRRGQALRRQIERDFGLRQLPSGRESLRNAPSRADLAAFRQTGRVTVRARLQEHLDLAARGGPTPAELVERLEAYGIEVRVRRGASGDIEGVSFAYQGFAFRGSDLGRGYSWSGLQERAGGGHNAGRDLAAEDAAAAARADSPPQGKTQARSSGAAPPRAAKVSVAAFRQAAILETRAELLARRKELAKALLGAQVASQTLRLETGDAHRAEALSAELRRTALFERALRRLPDAVTLGRELLRAAAALGIDAVSDPARAAGAEAGWQRGEARWLSRLSRDTGGRADGGGLER